MLKAMRSVHLRERLAVGRPLTDADLVLSRVDGTWLPVREYSREFAAQRTTAGLEAITLGKLRHSNISRMRAAGICGCRLARPYRAHDPGRLWACDRRPPDRSRGRLLPRVRTQSVKRLDPANEKNRSDTGQSGFLLWS
jgi:hypothetical protein